MTLKQAGDPSPLFRTNAHHLIGEAIWRCLSGSLRSPKACIVEASQEVGEVAARDCGDRLGLHGMRIFYRALACGDIANDNGFFLIC